MKFEYFFSGLILISSFAAINCNVGVKDVLKSGADITSGVSKDLPNKLPTPKGLFESSKQLIAGYPLEFVSSAINEICTSALISNTVTPKFLPNITEIKFQLMASCEKYSFPLLNASNMWTSPHFDPKKKVVIFSTGWTETVNSSETIDVMAKAYNCRGDVNFVAIDAAKYVDTLYTWAAFNTEDVGMHIAEGLKELIKIVPLENIHLIGHSLGAHIMGSAGRYFHLATGKHIPRITGLDPAKPCFKEGEALSGLLRGDADFIDVIHSNSGILGRRDPLGDIDFYPGGLDPLPPGCLNIGCAHLRSWRYYAETIYPGNELNFVGVRCSSLKRVREGKCISKEVPMGYAVPTDVKGNYFLEVNAEEPYGKSGSKQRWLQFENCGSCGKIKRIIFT